MILLSYLRASVKEESRTYGLARITQENIWQTKGGKLSNGKDIHRAELYAILKGILWGIIDNLTVITDSQRAFSKIYIQKDRYNLTNTVKKKMSQRKQQQQQRDK
ncbi:hypothetical protein JTB14_001125 [Gonioctena quinquepunctata]|nr:hypothetical protein JTB14_001125 [Gonioctena quinquepunctata]